VTAARWIRPITTRDFGWEVGAQWAQNKSLTTDLAEDLIPGDGHGRGELTGQPGVSDEPGDWGGRRRVVLGSYFATGSEFREPLLKSMFESH